MPWVGPFFVQPGSEVRVPVPPISATSHAADDALPAVPQEDDDDIIGADDRDDDDDIIGADDRVPKPLRGGRGRGRGGQRGRGRAGRSSGGALKRPAASKKRPAGVMRRPSAADGIAMRRPSAVVSDSASDGNGNGSDEIPVVAPARPVGDKTYGCGKCRHNKAGCPGRCRKLAKTGSCGYYFDEDGFVRHAK